MIFPFLLLPYYDREVSIFGIFLRSIDICLVYVYIYNPYDLLGIPNDPTGEVLLRYQTNTKHLEPNGIVRGGGPVSAMMNERG